MFNDDVVDNAQYHAILKAPMKGNPFHLGIKCSDDMLTAIDFLTAKTKPLAPKSALAKEVVAQFDQYFSNPKFNFDLPMHFHGTEHQCRVWRALQAVPAGQPVYYSQLASKLNSSARAVGGACRSNPVPIVVPCHRVVAKNGFGGFGGKVKGLNVEIKQWLLHHESPSV